MPDTTQPAVDPVTAYALAVPAGTLVASRLVRLACRRHLNDLEQQAAKGLVWKPEDAQEAIDFIEQVLCLPEETDANEDQEAALDVIPADGTLFLLSPFQKFIVGSLFGWFTAHISKNTGARRLQSRFRIAFFEGAKGCGKTPLFAAILIYMLVRHGVRGAQLFCAAVTKEQAKLAFADCQKMVQASPALRNLIDQKVNNLAVLATGSFIRPISSEKRGLDGKRVQGAVIEELHEHPNSIVVSKVRAGIKGRPDALILIPTNSGFDRESVCWEYHEYSRQVVEGTIVNEAWFGFICHLDACDSCYAAGHLQPVDECPNCDDWKTEGAHWAKANPNLGVSLPWQYLREQVREAIDIPSQSNIVRRLNFCQWTGTAGVWIPPVAWEACASSAVTPAALHGRECYIGIDLSAKLDLSAVVLVFPRPLTGAAHERPDNLNDAVDVLAYFWLPANSLQRRSHEDSVPYVDWKQQGWLTVTVGDLVDHDAIVDFILNDVATQYKIRGIGFDQAGATAVVTRLQRELSPDLVIEIPQSFRFLSEPCKTLEALVVSGQLRHDGNPVLRWNIGNTAVEENRWMEIRPVKISQRQRIDGAVALIDALAVKSRRPALREPEYQIVVIGGRR